MLALRFDTPAGQRAVYPARDVWAPILSGQALETALQKTVAVLRTGSASPFQHEAACRHALRIGFILKGNGWGQSDRQAAAILDGAFRRMGVERPSWEEGQHQATTPPEDCLYCQQPIPAAMRVALRRPRFCSAECAQAAIAHRDYKHERDYEAVTASAFRIAYAASQKPRACKVCGARFFPPSRNSKQSHCSKACSDVSQRVYPPITCEECGTTCTPAKPGSRFCSKECFYAHGHERRHESQCVYCAKHFRSPKPGALYCSASCSTRHYQYRSGRVVPRTFTPQAFDYFVAVAA